MSSIKFRGVEISRVHKVSNGGGCPPPPPPPPPLNEALIILRIIHSTTSCLTVLFVTMEGIHASTDTSLPIIVLFDNKTIRKEIVLTKDFK